VLWDLFSQRTGKTFFKSLTNISGFWFIVPVVLLLVVGLAYLRKREKDDPYQQLRFVSLVAIATTGFAGMGLELVLLFSFQNLLGYLYQYIGLIVACFMAGLAVGAATMNRVPQLSAYQGLRILLIIEIVVSAYSISLPLILSALPSLQGNSLIATASYWNALTGIVPFLILVALLGVVTGLEFPLVTRILIRAGGKPGRVAGLVDGFDHGGASLGAALTGTVFVPLFGLYYSSFLIAGANLVSGVLLSIALLATKRSKSR
jgi:spermidine synthase